jgi:L-rhamnose-H+ transport protein
MIASSNPYFAVTLHWIGGLAAASFYLPFSRVRKWSWETYWLTGGFFSWIIAPLFFAFLLVPHFAAALHGVSDKTLFWTYFFGVLWGLGGLTFGLTMRYLGIGLGMAIALSYCAAFGTMVPPIFDGTIQELLTHSWGWVTMAGVLVCLLGIGLSGLAGRAKEKELPEEKRKTAVREFNFRKGILVATFSGIMSACFNFGYGGLKGFNFTESHGLSGNPITLAAAAILRHHGQSMMWDALPTVVVVLWGGFTSNFIWCAILHLKNGSARQYIASTSSPAKSRLVVAMKGSDQIEPWKSADADSPPLVAADTLIQEAQRVPLLNNYAFSAIAGVTWYMQLFFYTAGQNFMPGSLAFSGWTLHMASIIIFATIWGVILHEWKGTSKTTHAIIAVGVATLVLSTIIVGAGNLMKSWDSAHAAAGAIDHPQIPAPKPGV